MGNDANGLYRKQALDRLAEGEQMDETVVLRSSVWTTLAAGLVLIAASLIFLAA